VKNNVISGILSPDLRFCYNIADAQSAEQFKEFFVPLVGRKVKESESKMITRA
jgi:hypothetical protein